jgi:UDP-glucose 4-epimerase
VRLLRLAITGVSGYLGRLAVASLQADEAVSAILGLDVAPFPFQAGKLAFVSMDVRSPRLAQCFQEHRVETVLHLAWIFNPTHNVRRTYDVDVNGSRNVLEACQEAGVRHVIIPGSTTAYGAHPDNPDWLTEESPRRGNRDFPYSHHKALVEGLCDAFEAANPQVTLTRLRACIVLGMHADNFVKTAILLRGPRHAVIRGSDPPMQFLHEEDMASALRLAVLQQPPGVYNITPDDTITPRQTAELLGNPVVEYPYWLLRPLAGLLWSLRQLPVPGSYLSFIRYRWTASNAKAKGALGWRPRYSSRQALAAMGVGRI